MKKTAITLSIERKENKVINFREEYKAYLELGNLDEMSRINAIVFELENEIEADKFLLTTEREQIEEAYKARVREITGFNIERTLNLYFIQP